MDKIVQNDCDILNHKIFLGQIIQRNGIYQFVAGQYQFSMNGEWIFVEGYNDNGVFIEGTWHNGFFTASTASAVFTNTAMTHGFHEMAMGTMNQGMTDHAWVVPMADKKQDPTNDDGNNDDDQGSTDADEADEKPRRK